MNIAPLLRDHGLMRVEHPPELWHADAEDVRLMPLVGEMIAFGMSRGSRRDELTVNTANVAIEVDSDGLVPAGEYIALSVLGKGDWRPEWTWRPGANSPEGAYAKFGPALANTGVVFAYTRQIGGGGSVTVFLRRTES